MTTDVLSSEQSLNFPLGTAANISVQPTEYYTVDQALNFTSEPALNSSTRRTRKRERTRGTGEAPAYVARDVFLYVVPIIFVFGNVGNGISFYVLRSGELEKLSLCFYMSVLAVSEAGILWTGFCRAWLPLVTKNNIKPELWLDCKLTMPLHFLFASISSAMLVVMCIEKCFGLFFALKAKYLCTVYRAKRVTMVTVVVVLLFNIQWLLTVRSNVIGGRHVGCKIAFKLQGPVRSLIVFVIPAVVMITCNSAIIVKLSMKRASGMVNTSSKAAKQATIMLLSVTSLFIFSTFPLQIFMFVTENKVRSNTFYISIILSMLNHSISVLLYLLSGSKYREGVRKMFRIRKNRVGVVIDSAQQR